MHTLSEKAAWMGKVYSLIPTLLHLLLCAFNYQSDYLEWFLPVVLKLLQVVLGAAASVAHPAEPVGEELADVGDPVVVEPVHHPLDHRPCLLRLAHVRVPGQHGLLWAASFGHLRVLRSLVPPPRLTSGVSEL